jgi:hypothetical protein
MVTATPDSSVVAPRGWAGLIASAARMSGLPAHSGFETAGSTVFACDIYFVVRKMICSRDSKLVDTGDW